MPAIDVQLDGPAGPRVVVDDGLFGPDYHPIEVEDVEAAVPEGWRVSWETPAVRLGGGRTAYALVRTASSFAHTFNLGRCTQ